MRKTSPNTHPTARTASLPPPLRPGDRVGIAALSGPIDPQRLATGRAVLETLGYRPVDAANLGLRHEFFAGSDAERVDAFHRLAAEPDIRAIVFARGGHGVLRLLPELDWELLAQHPRAYVGYSDLTPFLLQVVERLGWVAFHGPMVAADFARGLQGIELESFRGMLGGDLSPRFNVECNAVRERIEGRLVGGCLSLLTATLGTPYAANLDRSWLFIEDVNEPGYRLDRMLTHLHLSGSLASIQGMIVGHLSGTAESELRLRGVFERWAERLSVPLLVGVPAGHIAPNLTLPLGALMSLGPGDGSPVFASNSLRREGHWDQEPAE